MDDLICDDCAEYYDDCECGLDPDEYPEHDDMFAMDLDTGFDAYMGCYTDDV